VYHDLELHFGNCKNIRLFAENGYLLKTPETDGVWKKLFKFDNQCLPVVRRIMEQYVQKTEGSNIEYKDSSLIWKINSFWEEFGQKQADDLVTNLRSVLDRFHNIEVVQAKN
jgi:trehalose 6-phosphate synthase/phosphatase